MSTKTPKGSRRRFVEAGLVQRSPFPYFVLRDDDHNLRMVAPRLWVGAEHAPKKTPAGRWKLVVDLYGVPLEEGEDGRYREADEVLHWPFIDGEQFPVGLLDAAVSRVQQARAMGHVLVHCQAGLSRSASTAYACLRVLDGLSHEEAFQRVYCGEPDFPRKTTIGSARSWVQRQIGRR